MSYLFVISFRLRFLPARLSSCRSGRFLKEPQLLVEKPVRPLLGEVVTAVFDHHAPLSAILLWQRLVPTCPGVILDQASSRAVLRTRGAGTLAHQQARPRGRSIMVVCRRKARPFVLSAKLGLQENGRPSLKGMAPWPGTCSVGSGATGGASSQRSERCETNRAIPIRPARERARRVNVRSRRSIGREWPCA